MKQMMNRTLSRALLTWKQRTTELDVSEWRRIKVILAKALQSFGSNQLKRPFVAWKTFKMQDKGSRLQDQLQDQHVSRRTRVSRDPTMLEHSNDGLLEHSIRLARRFNYSHYPYYSHRFCELAFHTLSLIEQL